MLKLIIEDDEGRKTVVPFVRDEITIGREEGNTIRLTERNVSRRHARLLRQNVNVLIEDLGSYNGIKVNGDRITGQVQVQDGDLIQIGDYDLAIQREEEARAAQTVPLEAPRAAAPTMKLPDPGATLPALPVVNVPEASEDDVQEAPPLGDELPRHQSTAVIRIDQLAASRPNRSVQELDPNEAPRLVVLNTDFAGREFPCTKTELRIGRTDDNDVAIDHRSLSRTHCKVVREDSGEWKVIDLQSANGLMVNGEPYAQVTLRLGDVIELGHVKIKFVGAGDAVTLNTGASSSNVTTSESAQPSSSRGPLIAVVATLLVLVLGGGGYALFKSSGGDPKPKPPEVKPTPPDVALKPDPPTPPPPDQENARNEEAMADAMVALEKLDLVTAEALLKKCRVKDSPCPQAEKLLNQLSNEKPFARSLEEAGVALEKNDLDKARTALDAASSTQLFKARRDELTEQLSRKVAALIPPTKAPIPKPPEVRPTPPDPVAPPSDAKKAQIAKLLDEAKQAKKAEKYGTAIDRLKKCLELDKTNPDCTVTLASVHASKGSAETNTVDNERARALYQRFLEIAPPDDKRIERVKEILKTQ